MIGVLFVALHVLAVVVGVWVSFEIDKKWPVDKR